MTNKPGAPAKPSESKIRVLVVDDEPKVVELIKRKLEAHSYDVVTASNGEQALWHACNQRLDLILLDVFMPLMDGFEVLTRLKANTQTSQIPVVVCTILAHERLAFALGAADFIRKPVSRSTFLATLDVQLNRQPREAG